jgi:hypothetical protein
MREICEEKITEYGKMGGKSKAAFSFVLFVKKCTKYYSDA